MCDILYVGAACHVDTFINGGEIVCVTVRGSVKPSDEDCFGMCLNLAHTASRAGISRSVRRLMGIVSRT